MQGRHEYQPELFTQIDIEALIPKNHLLRKIDRVLDLKFLRDETASFYSADKGRPSIDPEIFVRMVLLGFLYNVDSDRQLCEEIGFNLAYRWFCRLSFKDSVPDHSSMTKVRDRLGEETYKKIFLKVVDQCREAGLVKGERLMADGSMIYANASLYNMVEREDKKEEEPSDKDNPPRVGRSGYTGSKDGLSNNDLRRNSLVGKKISNATHVSKSDPECSLSGKHGEYKSLRYKTHNIADTDSRVILDCHVTTGSASEVTTFTERLDVVQKDLGLNIKEVVADRGYGSGKNLEHLKEKGIKTNIPLWSTRVGTAFNKEVDFVYDKQTHSMTCPEGHKMKTNKLDNESMMFVVSKSICSRCPRYMSCVTDAQRRNGRGKRVRIHIYQETYNEVLEQEKQPEFKLKLRERMWKMEGLFAEGKSHHGLRRARYRGRSKLQVQVYMIATIQNLKRLAAAVFVDLILKLSNLTKTGSKFEKLQKLELQPAFLISQT